MGKRGVFLILATAVLGLGTTAFLYSKPSSSRVVNVTDRSFEKEVLRSNVPVLVDFWAVWCGPCRVFAPTVEKMAMEFKGKIKVAKVDVDQNPELSRRYQIRGIPTALIIRKGEVVRTWVGAASEKDLRKGIRDAL